MGNGKKTEMRKKGRIWVWVGKKCEAGLGTVVLGHGQKQGGDRDLFQEGKWRKGEGVGTAHWGDKVLNQLPCREASPEEDTVQGE